jgi:hypothetical protein
MGYYARERIFRGCGPNLPSWTVVFAAEDLTDDECNTLVASVQHCLDELHDDGGHGPWSVELGPSASENSAVFVNLKSEWEKRKAAMEEYRRDSNSWRAEISWLHDILLEHAEVIRNLRDGHTPTVYLQCDGGHGFETFDCVDSLTWEELDTLQSVLGAELYERGLILQIVSDWHAEREPDTYVQARISWKRFQEDMKNDDADETLVAAGNAAYEFQEEILALRRKPIVYGQSGDDEQVDEEVTASAPLPSTDQPDSSGQREAHESLRTDYRDRDNYWRNVWLYEQRKVGKTNSAIRDELAARAADFAPLESDNALRTAIETIALYHGWPPLKGKSGRPKANDANTGAK